MLTTGSLTIPVDGATNGVRKGSSLSKFTSKEDITKNPEMRINHKSKPPRFWLPIPCFSFHQILHKDQWMLSDQKLPPNAIIVERFYSSSIRSRSKLWQKEKSTTLIEFWSWLGCNCPERTRPIQWISVKQWLHTRFEEKKGSQHKRRRVGANDYGQIQKL